MTKDTALTLLEEYCTLIEEAFPPAMHLALKGKFLGLSSLIGMYQRFPPDGNKVKAMRWLGYAQGVLVADGVYTLDQVKRHSVRGYVVPAKGRKSK